jgi:hypothetical protein
MEIQSHDQKLYFHQCELNWACTHPVKSTHVITKFSPDRQENPTVQQQPINCNRHEKSLTSSMPLIGEDCVGRVMCLCELNRSSAPVQYL